jgi:error-prone DNA polymerase
MELLRPHLDGDVLSSLDLRELAHGRRVSVAGLVVARQRPATANGVVFMLLEDEHAQMNLIVPPAVYDRHRAVVRGEPLVYARGTFERQGENRNVVVRELASLSPLVRRVSGEAELGTALPDAHHFGHR